MQKVKIRSKGSKTNFVPIWAFLDRNSSVNSEIATKRSSELEVVWKRCPIYWSDPFNFNISRNKILLIWPQFQRFRAITLLQAKWRLFRLDPNVLNWYQLICLNMIRYVTLKVICNKLHALPRQTNYGVSFVFQRKRDRVVYRLNCAVQTNSPYSHRLVGLLTHKEHSISRPDGRAMENPVWELWENIVLLRWSILLHKPTHLILIDPFRRAAYVMEASRANNKAKRLYLHVSPRTVFMVMLNPPGYGYCVWRADWDE